MALNEKDTPVGLDLEMNKIQTLAYNYLTTNSCVKGDFSSYESYHRVYKNETKKGVIAETFLTGNDYKDVFMDDSVSVSSFMIADDDIIDLTPTRKQRTVSIIFQINLTKVYPNIPHRADQEFHNEVSNALAGLRKPTKKTGAKVGINNVYSEFEVKQLKDKFHDMQPYHVFRQDFEVQYDYDCCPVFATSACTIRITEIESTAETSLGTNDGTATVSYAGDQGNITFLWNDPAEQTTQTATGLSPNNYMVTVTDDNYIDCTEQVSVTVEAGEPIPSCDTEITGIVTTEETFLGAGNGTATATVIGNVGTIIYQWPNGESSNPATALSAGLDSLLVIDSGVAGFACADAFPYEIILNKYLLLDGDNDLGVLDTNVIVNAGQDYTQVFTIVFTSITPARILKGATGNNDVQLQSATQLQVRNNNSKKNYTFPTWIIGTKYVVFISRINDLIRVYANGVESSSGGQTLSTSTSFGAIGHSASVHLDAGIDNVGLSLTRGGTPSDVATHNANPCKFVSTMGGAEVFFTMNEDPDSQTANDLSGNGNNLTLVNVTSTDHFKPWLS